VSRKTWLVNLEITIDPRWNDGRKIMSTEFVEVMEYELKSVRYQLKNLRKMGCDKRMLNGTMERKCSRAGEVYHVREVGKNNTKHSRKIGGETGPEVIARKQARFNAELIRTLERNEQALARALEILRRDYKPYDADAIDERIGESYVDRTGLVNKYPGIMRDEQWRLPVNAKKGLDVPEKQHIAMDGQIVRSKSELVVYNMLLSMGIPFNYEEPIELEKENANEIPYYADFVVHLDDGRTVVIEVMGMLSQQKYFDNAARKLRYYVLGGYTIGKDLIIIADKNDGTLDSCAVRKVFENMFGKAIKRTA